MDSISQIVLGASVAVIVTKASKHRRIILWAAFLATLPDLDIFFPALNDLELALSHRTWTHSWVIQSFLTPLVSWVIYKIDKTLSYFRWCLVVWSVWITHSALDVCTIYGTHLFWPFGGSSIFLGNIFIVDPLYTLPFLLAFIVAIFVKQKQAYRWVSLGLIISNMYLLWTLFAQQWVLNRAVLELKKKNISYQKLFVGPTYFNSFLWRVVVLNKDNYYEGFGSVFDKKPSILFKPFSRNLKLLSNLNQEAVVKKFQYFSHGYYRVEVEDNNLSIRLVDLRMGWSVNYYFKYKIAERENSNAVYKSIAPKRIFSRPLQGEMQSIWDRIWVRSSI